jgi:valyl-tRNA synthetase
MIDNSGKKMLGSNAIDPEDLIEGSIKSNGERKFGFGVDVLRAWSVLKDTDKTMFVNTESFDKTN